jgi:hypothetical protein
MAFLAQQGFTTQFQQDAFVFHDFFGCKAGQIYAFGLFLAKYSTLRCRIAIWLSLVVRFYKISLRVILTFVTNQLTLEALNLKPFLRSQDQTIKIMKNLILLILITGFQYSGSANCNQPAQKNPWRKYHRPKQHCLKPEHSRRFQKSMFGISRLPFGAFCLPHGRRNVFFHDGYFYRKSSSCYSMIPAPVGIFIPRLPFNALKIFHNGLSIWFLAGNFYRESNNGFLVIETPLGIRVPELPEADLEPVFLEGEKFFLFKNVLWKKRESRHALYFEAIDYWQS